MTMQLRLDADALAKLFPEGSQARVELQNAVVAEFIKKHVSDKLVADDVQRLIKSAKSEAVTEVMRELGVHSQWGNVVLSDTFKNKLKEQVREQVTSHIHQSATDAAMTLREDLGPMIEKRIELLADQIIEKRIGKELGDRLSKAIQLTLKG